jgi:drug/metabolite transporter (DMT)-like permease
MIPAYMQKQNRSQTIAGILMALTACILWSFNFIIARGISKQMPPVAISFFRWLCASIIIIPIAWQRFSSEKHLIGKHWKNILFATLMGISLYSPLIYLAGHYSPAVNLALIGTTSTPVFTFLIAGILFKEKIPPLSFVGLVICIAGIILLLSKGRWDAIIHFHFTTGDKWMLLGAFFFAVYNILVRKKAKEISSLTYLFVTFILGTLLLLPMYIWEAQIAPPIAWNFNLLLIVLYSGAGTSVAAFFCWNAAIQRIGSSRTSVFGNLIPVLASFEAVWLLHETVTFIQIASMFIVTVGLILATYKK